MITTQYEIRLDLKGEVTYRKADERLTKCHEALYTENTVSVESMSGNGVCAPYIKVIVEDLEQARQIEARLQKILGRWLDRG